MLKFSGTVIYIKLESSGNILHPLYQLYCRMSQYELHH